MPVFDFFLSLYFLSLPPPLERNPVCLHGMTIEWVGEISNHITNGDAPRQDLTGCGSSRRET